MPEINNSIYRCLLTFPLFPIVYFDNIGLGCCVFSCLIPDSYKEKIRNDYMNLNS